MSDLGAIFHVKKNGTQYNAHAYTTLDECPYPNLKIKTKSGTQGYVKLTTNGSGDVPFRVKPKSESTTYQVVAEATPSGSLVIAGGSTVTFTVPNNIKVIKVGANNDKYITYVGVTPGSTHTLSNSSGLTCTTWAHGSFDSDGDRYIPEWSEWRRSGAKTLYWSADINKQTPTVEDYSL